MALDQIHEQNNRVIKSCAGAVDLVNKEDESALICWETCDHDIARIINEFEESVTYDYYNHNPQKHHEDNDSFCSKFDNDVKTLVMAIPVNPFQIDNLCKINNTKYVVPDGVFHNNVKTLEEMGEEQYSDFVYNRLVFQKVPVSDPIPNNNINIWEFHSDDESGKSSTMKF